MDKNQLEQVWKKILQLQSQEERGSLRIRDLAEKMQVECGIKPLETSLCVGMLRKLGFIKIGYAEYAPNKIADDLIHIVEEKRDADIGSGEYRKILGSPRASWLGDIFGETGLLGIGGRK